MTDKEDGSYIYVLQCQIEDGAYSDHIQVRLLFQVGSPISSRKKFKSSSNLKTNKIILSTAIGKYC